MITRHFEYTGGGSDKFWEVEYPDAPEDRGRNDWTCRWGRRGSPGQVKGFRESNAHAARAAAMAKIDEKVRKGYVEIALPGGWRPTVRPVAAVVPARRTGKTAAQDAQAIAHIAIDLARTTGISVQDAMSLIERASQTQVTAPAAAAIPRLPSKTKRQIILE